MIRLIQRRLIVPRGDTGTFSIPVLAGKDSGDTSIFTIFSPLTHRKIFEKVMENSNGVLKMDLTHGDTVNLPVGEYVWDIKFYTDPIFVDEKLVSGTEVDSYYSAFQLPVCEIRETGDNLLMADDAPDSKLAPEQINYIDAAIVEIHNSKDAAASSAAEADTSATNAETSASAAAVSEAAAQDSQVAALASQQAAQAAASEAASSAALASQKAAEIGVELENKADKSEIPTLVSQLQNDAGYLSQETDPTVPAWAKAQTKPSYTPQEVGALPANTYIPNKTSDLVNDSNYPVDANYIHTDNNYTTEEKNKLSGIAAGAEVNVNADWNAVSGDAFILNKPTKVSEFTNDAGYLTEHQDISGKANSADLAAVATSGSYNDLGNKPFIPSRVSDLTDDSGHYTKPANGIPASDLEETYLTSFTETDPTVPNWAKQAQKPSYTAQEVGALPADTVIPTVPTNVSAFTNDAGYITGYTETDPTVPSWAKAAQKPSYTAAEVGAPTVQEMNSAISTAIGNINSFDMAVVQELPIQNINTHTIYLVPKTGETNDVYDEYVYINNAWEMIGNTQIDLSNYVQFNNYASSSKAGVVKIPNNLGIYINPSTGEIMISSASSVNIKEGINIYRPLSPAKQHESTFYGLAKAAGDTTQSQSNNAVGTYTTEAKAAILNMFGLQLATDAEIQTIINGGAGA